MNASRSTANDFVCEAREHLALVEAGLLAAECGQDIAAQIDRCFRGMHSLKGGAGLLGLRNIRLVANRAENLLDALRAGTIPVSTDCLESLLVACDRLGSLIDDLAGSDDADIAATLARLDQCLQTAAPLAMRLSLDLATLEDTTDRVTGFFRRLIELAEVASPRVALSAIDVAAPFARPELRYEVDLLALGTPALIAERLGVAETCLVVPDMPAGAGPQPIAGRAPCPPSPLVLRSYDLALDLRRLADRGVASFFQELVAACRVERVELRIEDPAIEQGLPRGAVLYSARLETTLSTAELAARLGLAESDFRALDEPPPYGDAPAARAAAAEASAAAVESQTRPASASPPVSSAPPVAPSAAGAPPVARSTAAGLPSATVTPASTTAAPSAAGSPALSVAARAVPAAAPVGLPAAPAESPSTAKASSAVFAETDRSGSVRIQVELLDRLMNLAGELLQTRNELASSRQAQDPELAGALQRLRMVSSEMQNTILLARMQPVGNLFLKFPRLVRNVAKQLGKQIELEVQGTEVELDKSVIEMLSDPLTHIIRNGCDHGIEAPEERARRGKPTTGKVTLRARHEGRRIAIEICDDGRGIDMHGVRRKALALGLRSEVELDHMDRRELMELILLPGFTTTTAVTELSGRGVGMDVVKTNIERLGGSLSLSSTPGEGTVVLLHVPLTLAIIPCLLATIDNGWYAIPQKDVEEIVYLHGEQIDERLEVAFDQEFTRLRGQLLPLVRLQDVFAHPQPLSGSDRRAIIARHHGLDVAAAAQRAASGSRAAGSQRTASGSRAAGSRAAAAVAEQPAPRAAPVAARELFCVVVRGEHERYGMIVDHVHATEEIVVKPMHRVLRGLGCFAGATILGDGGVALILNTVGIAKHAGLAMADPRTQPLALEGRDRQEQQTVLVFKAGPQERFVVPLHDLRRVERISADRIDRVGDREFVTLDAGVLPIVRLDQSLPVSAIEPSDEYVVLLPVWHLRPYAILATAVVDSIFGAVSVDTDGIHADGLVGSTQILGEFALVLDVFRVESQLPKWTPPALPGPESKLRRVLLVEDTQFFRQVVRHHLESAGYRVTTVEHGAAALVVLERETFDLVISDIEMPVMDGWTLAQEIRRRYPERKFRMLALTTLHREEDRAKSLASGFDRHEVKLDPQRLLDAAAALLETRHERR